MHTIADPACGTGGFFLAAYDWLTGHRELDKEQKEFLKYHTFAGNEIVAGTRRLALMNLFPHNIGDINSQTLISPADSLIAASDTRYDYVLANPPFGKKSSMTFTNEEGEQEKEDLTYNRQDFWVTTSNKQLNFGSGFTGWKDVQDNTKQSCESFHPVNLDSDNGATPWTREVWVYDYRTNIHHTLKKNPLQPKDLQDFITCYNPANRHQRTATYNEQSPDGRWRKFTYDEIIARDKTSLDITWLKDKSLADLDNLPDPDVLAAEIVENIESALDGFKNIIARLNQDLQD